MQEPLEAYLDDFDRLQDVVEDLLELTVDLARAQDLAAEILATKDLLEAVRYLSGPPISADDLKVLSEASLAPSRLKRDPVAAKRVVETVLLGLDRRRFPWVTENREPSEAERHAAVVASATLMASRSVMTKRANESKTELEAAVMDSLRDAGFVQVATRNIQTLDDAPARGEFCGESKFGERKADIVLRLGDGRAMPMECKVSNSSTNSVKRLNNDAAAKASVWLNDFGSLHVVPTAVLAGVFKTHNLEQAQHRGLSLFWAHDLAALVNFALATKARPRTSRGRR